MKYLLTILTITTMMISNQTNAQTLEFSKIKAFENQLDYVMELIDTVEVKLKLKEVEESYKQNLNEITKTRLGIIYHETALNLSFLSKSEFKGYAQKSFDVLNELCNDPNISKELFPFITSYRASALSLVCAETRKLKLLTEAFILFEESVKNYGFVSPYPEFLRGSVAENLPWFFVSKRKAAKNDFQSIIEKYNTNPNYATWKVMSITYWAWANQHKNQKKQALIYLEKSIELDPNYKAGRKKAEVLKAKLMK